VGIIRTDDQHPDFLEIVATDADRPEGNSGSTIYTFTVNRSGLDLNRTTTVNYSVSGQGANPAEAGDFTGGVFPSGTITFTSGQTSQTVQIQVSGDATVESDEGFQVTLSNPSALAVINTASATGIIRNDDFHPDFLEITATDADKPEGNSGTTAFTFTVIRSGLDLNRTTTVNYTVLGQGANPASGSDFATSVFPSGTITFTSGQTSQTLEIQIAGDTTVEPDEGFQVVLSNPSALAVINTATASGVIRNDDFHPDFLAIATTDADKPEGDSGATVYSFTISRIGLDLNRTTTVNYAVTGQGANPASASDFVGGVFPSGTITFTSGQTSQTVQIQVSGDTAVESDEGFEVTLSNPSALAIINTASANGVIRNDDFHPDFLEIVATDADKPEGNSGSTTYTFTVNRSVLDLNRTTTVNYAVTGQGANPASASDFVGGVFPSGTVTFNSGQTSQTVQIQVAGDTTVESDEGFQVTLSNPSALAVINTAAATGFIRNDDFHPDFLGIVATDADKPEGNSGPTSYTFTINRNGSDLNRTTTVNYTVTGQGANPADASDFVGGIFPTGTITFTSGQTSQTLEIQASGDTTVEFDEGFLITLSDPSPLAVINTASASGVIRNDDFHPDFLEIVATDADKPEGNSGPTTFTFTIQRTGLDLNRVTTVSYSVNGLGADPASTSDFVGGNYPSGIVTFAAGQASHTLEILVSGDTTVEADEGFEVTLSSPSALAVINTASAAGLIRNDDSHPDFLEIVATDADQPEGNSGTTIYTFTINRSGIDLNRTTTVNYAVTGQGANPASASDFAGGVWPSGTVTLAPGQTSETIEIEVVGDTLVEFDERFAVTLSDPSTFTVLAVASASGTIRDDDTPNEPDRLEIVATDAVKPEGLFGPTPFTFTINRSGSSLNHTTTVEYSVSSFGANPASPNDFVGNAYPSGTIQFLPGQTSFSLVIMVNGDMQPEPDEGFRVTLSNASLTTVIDTAVATGLIQRDELESGNNGNSGSSASTVERLSSSAISLVRLGTSLPTAPLPTEPTDRIWFKPPKRFSKSWWRRKLKFW
jgi:sulfur transfer complex TusBCD TusB component (DsrH family)